MSFALKNTFRTGIVDTDTSLDFHKKDTLTSLVNCNIIQSGDNSVIKEMIGNYKAGGVGGDGKLNEDDVYIGNATWGNKIYLFYTTKENINGHENYILEYDSELDTFTMVLKTDLGIPEAGYSNINNFMVSANVVYGEFLYFTLSERFDDGSVKGVREPKRIHIEDAKYAPFTYSSLSGNLPRPTKLSVKAAYDSSIKNNLLKFNSYVFYKVLTTKYNERTVLSYPSKNVDVSDGGNALALYNRINILGFTVPDEVNSADIYMSNDSSNTLFKIASFDTTINKYVPDIDFYNSYEYPVAGDNTSQIINYEFPLTAAEQELVENRIVYGNVNVYYEFIDTEGYPIDKSTPFNFEIIANDNSVINTPIPITITQEPAGWNSWNIEADFELGETYIFKISNKFTICNHWNFLGTCAQETTYAETFEFRYIHTTETAYLDELNALIKANSSHGMEIDEWEENNVNNNFKIVGRHYMVMKDTSSLSLNIYKIENVGDYVDFGLNSDFSYKSGIVYLDEQGRNKGVSNITKIRNKDNISSTVFNVITNLGSTSGITPPYWAKKYMIVRDKINTAISYSVLGEQKESKVRISANVLKVQTSRYINYFGDKEGHDVTIYSKTYLADINARVLSDADIEAERDGGLDLSVSENYLYIGEEYTFEDGSVILYQPTKEVESKSEIFYETSEVFDIRRNSDDSVEYTGDGKVLEWYDTRIGITLADFGGGEAGYSIPIMLTDIEKLGEINHLGRGAYTYIEDVNMHTDATLIHSQHYSPSTNYNGLNAFSSLLNNFKDLDTKYGRVEKLFYTETDLLVGQLRKMSKMLINKSMISDVSGGNTIIQNKQFFNDVVPYNGEYGITDKRSFASHGFRKYFVDANNGVMIRLSMDGISVINGSRHNEIFNMISYQKNSEYYAGGFDPNKEEYVLTISMAGMATRFSEIVKNNTGDYDSATK